MASMLVSVLCSDFYFRKGRTPGGYGRQEMNSACYTEVVLFAPPAEAAADPAFPGEQDFVRWESFLRKLEEMLTGIIVRKTAVALYPVFIVDPACRRGAGAQKLLELMQGMQTPIGEP